MHRAEILQNFRVIFGSNENFKIFFRDLLTFTCIPFLKVSKQTKITKVPLTFREKIKSLSSTFFKNDIIDVMLFLEEVQIKDDQDKSRFFTSLPNKLDNIPKDICIHKILPECIKAFDFSNAGALILVSTI